MATVTNTRTLLSFYSLYWVKQNLIYQFVIFSVFYYIAYIINYSYYLTLSLFLLSISYLVKIYFNDKELRNIKFYNILRISDIEILHAKLILLYLVLLIQFLFLHFIVFFFPYDVYSIYLIYFILILFFYYFFNIYKIKNLIPRILIFIIYYFLMYFVFLNILIISCLLFLILTILINKNEYRN